MTNKSYQRILLLQIFLIVPVIFSCAPLWSQTTTPAEGSVYEFLDEMASLNLIRYPSVTLPDDRDDIAALLKTVSQQSGNLNMRQQKELKLWLKEYAIGLPLNDSLSPFQDHLPVAKLSASPVSLHYARKNFRLSAEPLLNYRLHAHSNNQTAVSTMGASATAFIGSSLYLYADYGYTTDHNGILSQPRYLSSFSRSFERDSSVSGYGEFRGGLVWKWKWGSLGIRQDVPVWGEGYNGKNILSGNAPAFPMISFGLHPVSWLYFRYFHAWLSPVIADSTSAYLIPGSTDEPVSHPKFMAANIYTFYPWKSISFSFGNSIVYSDIKMHPAYLIPFSFFKSIDHTVNQNIDNQNSQMFFSMSIRKIKHLHLYSTLYIDELSVGRIGDPNRHNFYCIKTGGRLTGWPVSNLTVTTEFTRSSPLTYEHRVPSLRYTNDAYGLGWYLRDNAQELFARLDYQPVAAWRLYTSYTHAIKAPEYNYDLKGTTRVDEYPVLGQVVWASRRFTLGTSWMITPNILLFGEYMASSVKGYDGNEQTASWYLNRFSPEFFRGNHNILSAGIRIGSW